MTPAFALLTDFLAAQTASEAAAAWPKGPTVGYRGSSGVPIASYIGWLREIETSPALRSESVTITVQRLRRLYYSSFTAVFKGATASSADEIMDDVMAAEAPPLTTDHISERALNGLFGTRSVRTARGLDVDIGHVWMVADWLVNGGSLMARAYLDSELSALFSWAGDLGSAVKAFRDHESVRVADDVPSTAIKKQVLLDAVKEFAAKDDLLGDLDAVVLGRRWETMGGSFVLSTELENYYKDDIKTQAQAKLLTYPHSARRFHYFLKVVEPDIPIQGEASAPLDISLKEADATAAITAALTSATADTWKKSIAEINRKLDDRGRAEFNTLIAKFVEFLKVGLRDGDALWPPAAL